MSKGPDHIDRDNPGELTFFFQAYKRLIAQQTILEPVRTYAIDQDKLRRHVSAIGGTTYFMKEKFNYEGLIFPGRFLAKNSSIAWMRNRELLSYLHFRLYFTGMDVTGRQIAGCTRFQAPYFMQIHCDPVSFWIIGEECSDLKKNKSKYLSHARILSSS